MAQHVGAGPRAGPGWHYPNPPCTKNLLVIKKQCRRQIRSSRPYRGPLSGPVTFLQASYSRKIPYNGEPEGRGHPIK